MKLGVSTYSLVDKIVSRQMSVLDVIEWIAKQGGEHVEIVPQDTTWKITRRLRMPFARKQRNSSWIYRTMRLRLTLSRGTSGLAKLKSRES